MTRLSAAMVRMLRDAPDSPHGHRLSHVRRDTLAALESRRLVEIFAPADGSGFTVYRRTPFGRETAERLARRAEK